MCSETLARRPILKASSFAAGLLCLLSGCPPEPGETCILGAGGLVIQPDFQPTLLAAELLLDGKVLGSASDPVGTSALGMTGTKSIDAGRHTFGIRVAQQTVTSNNYEFSLDQGECTGSGGTQSFSIPATEATVATGHIYNLGTVEIRP